MGGEGAIGLAGCWLPNAFRLCLCQRSLAPIPLEPREPPCVPFPAVQQAAINTHGCEAEAAVGIRAMAYPPSSLWMLTSAVVTGAGRWGQRTGGRARGRATARGWSGRMLPRLTDPTTASCRLALVSWSGAERNRMERCGIGLATRRPRGPSRWDAEDLGVARRVTDTHVCV